jgi:hypothetical protein
MPQFSPAPGCLQKRYTRTRSQVGPPNETWRRQSDTDKRLERISPYIAEKTRPMPIGNARPMPTPDGGERSSLSQCHLKDTRHCRSKGRRRLELPPPLRHGVRHDLAVPEERQREDYACEVADPHSHKPQAGFWTTRATRRARLTLRPIRCTPLVTSVCYLLAGVPPIVPVALPRFACLHRMLTSFPSTRLFRAEPDYAFAASTGVTC